MAEISIFEDEAFSVSSLLSVVNQEHALPGQITGSGLFEEEGISTTVAQIEKDGNTLQLVAAQPRGGVAQSTTGDKRDLVPFNTVHLPQTFKILADEIQGIRAVGSQTELQQVEAVVTKRVNKCRQQLDLTHEYQRVGALQGKVIDADGTTVLVDIYQRFGITAPKAFSLGLNNQDTDVSAKCREVLDEQEDQLGAVVSTAARAYAGKVFWDKLVGHAKVKETYLNSEQGAALRQDLRVAFLFGGIIWERYRGKINGEPFIADDEALVYPEGVPGLFISVFAPADYMEVVNTEGLPYYAKLEDMPFGKGVAGEVQSNPLHLCTKPLTVRRVKV